MVRLEEDLRQEYRLAALLNPEQRTDVSCAKIYDLWKLWSNVCCSKVLRKHTMSNTCIEKVKMP